MIFLKFGMVDMCLIPSSIFFLCFFNVALYARQSHQQSILLRSCCPVLFLEKNCSTYPTIVIGHGSFYLADRGFAL